ncbi:hypothetical protein Q9R19_02000 [Microbacterium sp. ARD32]|uniref:hypothetical protein n=1 Tax=Microbacterium sp. ARD32 TaxID=2962577 RepID=UPI002881135D|nr:hypothetical protein [Microbacterium sp. ARD32]MDT0156389.1 hypothetical protein [Microbacterium sp. ARD32]
MITTTLAIPMIAISTLATIIFIGLGFLPRPSRATALWAAAFALAMIGSYVWLAQDYGFPSRLRALGSALMVAPMPLVWSGLRVYRGLRRSFLPLSFAVLVAVPAILLAANALGVYTIAFRVVFVAMAVFAALIIVDLLRLGPQLRDEAMPLLGVSAAYVLLAGIILINGVVQATGGITPDDSLDLIRNLNMIGVDIYVTCTLVTTLLLTTRSGDASSAPDRSFERTARARLARAQAAGDEWWVLLDIRLDDPDQIRLASSTAAFNAVCEKFAQDIDGVLPADADIERLSPTRFAVLLPRSQGGVRELLTELLERVTTSDAPSLTLSLRPSASIGWASVAAVGYEYDDLAAAAADAADTAFRNGGDRWERTRGDE